MPLVAHSQLPTFTRLEQEGHQVLKEDRASEQDIREQHIGLLNMMPDAALEATERQFYRLIGNSNSIIQMYVHPFTLPEIPRGEKAQQHIDLYYETFESIKAQGLDALIITGANVMQPSLPKEDFWQPLIAVVDWAVENVATTLCSCLATHAVMEAKYKQVRRPLKNKRWGVYSHQIINKHPLVEGINTQFDVPHSRLNQVDRAQFNQSGGIILAESKEAGVHLAVCDDGLSLVFFQGHPEYDTISLLKEYKREVGRYIYGDTDTIPPFPKNYFDQLTESLFLEYLDKVNLAKEQGEEMPVFPEHLVTSRIHNTWHDTGEVIIGKWLGLAYQYTNNNRLLRLMEGVDHSDPLGLKQSKVKNNLA
ncbi:MAG TPA: homoserine O-succinyltransferase [Thiotrichaceae bacterium]|nr:homoserine O-succinyltransferase [Thiotrichaceae bacterium]